MPNAHDNALERCAPVNVVDTGSPQDDDPRKAQEGIALCLSGGDKTILLAQAKTRLKRLDAIVQERIINWGYAVCDAAMRKWVDQALPPPPGFPFPATGIG